MAHFFKSLFRDSLLGLGISVTDFIVVMAHEHELLGGYSSWYSPILSLTISFINLIAYSSLKMTSYDYFFVHTNHCKFCTSCQDPIWNYLLDLGCYLVRLIRIRRSRNTSTNNNTPTFHQAMCNSRSGPHRI